jgi:hypothetical protein
MTPEEFYEILRSMPEPKPVFWRLYYDDQGRPICYSMEDLPGNYIDIDSEIFSHAPINVRVVNGVLKYITHQSTDKLVPSDQGTLCHRQDVAVVVHDNGTFWSKNSYGLE